MLVGGEKDSTVTLRSVGKVTVNGVPFGVALHRVDAKVS